eukprot:GEMP01064279.1.p1 GENE.GEMP01064279.1~~GEMP01064279.1.p1  ORF type:complete len:288 (+),score=35.67 GEMP01064279.1:36-866(+)
MTPSLPIIAILVSTFCFFMEYYFPFPWTATTVPFYAKDGFVFLQATYDGAAMYRHSSWTEWFISNLPGVVDSADKNDVKDMKAVHLFSSAGHWRDKPITEVRDVRRGARLGFWGWLLTLHHTVVEVEFDDGHSILCEKNGDTGVWIRHRRMGERMYVRQRYPATNLAFGDFFDQVRECESFSESIERSNCQHFSLEVLQLLERGGWIRHEAPLKLANYDLAVKLRDYGMLDDKLKYKVKEEHAYAQLMRHSMCWGFKGSLTQLFCPWIYRFHLQKV